MSSSSTETTLVDVTMPQMGVSVAEGTVVEWREEVGDWVEAEETICEISTDKIDTEVPSPAAGRVAEIVVAGRQTVDVGTVMARIATDAKPGRGARLRATARRHQRGRRGARRRPARPRRRRRAGARRRPDAPRAAPATARGATRRSSSGSPPSTASTSSRSQGTGRGGRVRKQDVLAFVESGARAEEPPLHIESPYRPEPAPPRPARAARTAAVPRGAAPAAGRGGRCRACASRSAST